LAGFPASPGSQFDLYEFTTDADVANVMFVYLQVLGWYVLLGTRTAATAHYEFVRGKMGERTGVQVKSGETWIDTPQYADEEKAFLFAASGNCRPAIPSGAEGSIFVGGLARSQRPPGGDDPSAETTAVSGARQ
jgi:hypothetical protein